MLKRWADWPRGIRWLVGIAVTVLAVAIVWGLFVPVADWLAHHDVGSVGGSLHETAVDNVRSRLLTLGAGLFAAWALVFTARNFTLSREGQVTDRYTKAIEQLGSDKLDVRIGGIYALERVARDSARDHPAVMEVLTAFIREHSHEPWPTPDPEDAEREHSIRPDVQAAVTVVGRRDAKRDIRPIDFTRAFLAGANLTQAALVGADLKRANLENADLTNAFLTSANLAGADLTQADLRGADLTNADLTHLGAIRVDLPRAKFTPADLNRSLCAKLSGADLTNADLHGANFRGADLTGAELGGTTLVGATLDHADLRGAYLAGANLTGANLTGADLTGTHLGEVDFTGADLTNATLSRALLVGADLAGAHLVGTDFTGVDPARVKWPEDVPVPEGWKRDLGTGRLVEAGTDSGLGQAQPGQEQ